MKTGNEEFIGFAETVGAKMYDLLAKHLKRKQSIFNECQQEDVMLMLVNTGLMPLVVLSRAQMFSRFDPESFAQHIAEQFVKLNAVVTKVPKPTRH